MARAHCNHLGAPAVIARDGIACSRCETIIMPLRSHDSATVVEVSTHHIPPDCPNAAAFNRACRSGRVHGARKIGRVWLCTREAWDQRTAAPRPSFGNAPRARRTTESTSTPACEVSADLLAQLGATEVQR